MPRCVCVCVCVCACVHVFVLLSHLTAAGLRECFVERIVSKDSRMIVES